MNNRIKETKSGLLPYLSPFSVWALAFGCAVGWGSFVMPGTTFLPSAGPLGSAIGLALGAVVMLVIAVNYYKMMKRFPDSGGAYTFISRIVGNDHGFLCAWMLILTYAAVIWANSTAMSLISRYLFGDALCFGFSYEIFGYTVYLGEVLVTMGILVVTGLICLLSRRLSAVLQNLGAVLMFVCVTVCFVAVVIHRGGFSDLAPAFSKTAGSPAIQVVGIVMLAPWAFVGFESISNSADEFKFPVKKSLKVMIAALVFAALDYIMLTLCASMATPDGFADWGDYIASLARLDGIKSLPTFYAAEQAMGSMGLITLGVAAVCGILTALIGYYIALSRLFYRMSNDGVLREFSRLNKHGNPAVAILFVMGVSCVIPFLGRSTIGWIVDVTTVGALIVYAYVSICAFIEGRREKRKSTIAFGLIGVIISFVLILFFIIPALSKGGLLSTESYLILILWSILGLVLFRLLIQRDMKRNMGKSGIVWIILLVMILAISFVWIEQRTASEADDIIADVNAYHERQAQKAGLSIEDPVVVTTQDYIDERIDAFSWMTRRNVVVQNCLILGALVVVFSIYSLIKKREKQIEEEKLRAEENSHAKTTFLSNMSHDIRTPMNAIIGYTELAKREDVSEKLEGYLDKIELSGNHLLALINDILDMSRIESGKVELEVAPADLCAMADEIGDMFALQMESKSLRFQIDCRDLEDRYIICDRHRLSRVLMNLVSNAYKFTPEGGTITLTMRELEKENDAASYLISVADTGIGMSEAFAKTIFNAFERERTSTVSKIQGTGLGMSIAKSLIELMGGTIEVETKQGEGTTFLIRVSFALSDEASVKPEKALSGEAAAREIDFSNVRLLLAEDNPINQEIACAVLMGEGFSVDVAEDGKQAVEMIENADPNSYAAVLMDVQMPVMGGYEATRAIRALDDDRAKIPIIAVSANTFEDDRRASKEAGMNAHVSKPYSPDQLVAVLGELIFPADDQND